MECKTSPCCCFVWQCGPEESMRILVSGLSLTAGHLTSLSPSSLPGKTEVIITPLQGRCKD